MLYKCANPACSSLFRSLSHGKLFLLHTDGPAAGGSGVAPAIRRGRSALPEWSATGYATTVSPLLTLTFERGRGMITVPIPARNTSRPALHLRQMQPTVKCIEQS